MYVAVIHTDATQSDAYRRQQNKARKTLPANNARFLTLRPSSRCRRMAAVCSTSPRPCAPAHRNGHRKSALFFEDPSQRALVFEDPSQRALFFEDPSQRALVFEDPSQRGAAAIKQHCTSSTHGAWKFPPRSIAAQDAARISTTVQTVQCSRHHPIPRFEHRLRRTEKETVPGST